MTGPGGRHDPRRSAPGSPGAAVPRGPRVARMAAGVLAALVLAGAAWLGSQLLGHALPAPATPLPAGSQDQQARGAYLAAAGNCAGCHTARGGAPWAGGRSISTPFGTVVSANLTPDPANGLGRWSESAFVRALQQGRSADGRLLVPACPYPNFASVPEADLRDLFAYLRSQPAVPAERAPHALRFPYGTQAALAAWRGVFFHPQPVPEPPAGQGAAWQRGAQLVAGLGHCNACHGQRNAWGATDGPLDLRGGALAGQGWWAPALDVAAEAGVADWALADIVQLLRSGQARGATVAGPMAMVVKNSTQHLNDADLLAMATYLQALPQRQPPPRTALGAGDAPDAPDAHQQALGARLYGAQCAACHGAQGEGRAGMPALAGNRAVVMEPAVNVVRVVLGGGYGPSTAAIPQPHGMPPFGTLLGDADIAAVVNHLRRAWGHSASTVTALDVNRQRGSGP